MTAQQLGIRIDVDELDRRELQVAPQRLELGDHFVAEIAAFAMKNCEPNDGRPSRAAVRHRARCPKTGRRHPPELSPNSR